MTYVVGVKYGVNAAIITDSRVTHDSPGLQAENTWLKSGLFFPGCSFAYCGCVEIARDFVIRCKEHLSGNYSSLADLWERFTNYIESYDFPTNPYFSFELLLLSRASGTPRIYVLDSQTRLLRFETREIVTLGRGKEFLDDFVNANFANVQSLGSGSDDKPELPPWMWCLQLMERSQGAESKILNANGVGGYFHFCYQTPNMEARQPPALYVLCDLLPKTNQLSTQAFRVRFCGPSMVVECPLSNQRFIIFDCAAWPRINSLSGPDLENLVQEIHKEADGEPFYNFCGFGSLNPAYRGRNPAVVTCLPDYVIDRKGKHTANYSKMAASIFATPAEAEVLMMGLVQKAAPVQ